jgi:hypothetical protein
LEQDMANTAHTTLEVTPRHLWLALLGGANLARRGLVDGACQARVRAGRLGEALRSGVEDTQDIALGLALTVQEKLAGTPPHRGARRRAR